MPRVTLSSDSDRQTVIFAGVPQLLAGVTVDVTHEQVNAIQTRMAGWDESMRKSVRLQWELDPIPAVVPVKPTVPVVIPPPKPEEEPFVLSDEDRDLIEIEINKILGLTILLAEPLVLKTALSPDLPLGLRIEYLKALIAHPNAKRGIKDVAEKLLEQLT